MPVKGRTLLYVSAFTNSNATRKEAVSLFPLASLRYVLYLEATNSAYGTVYISLATRNELSLILA